MRRNLNKNLLKVAQQNVYDYFSSGTTKLATISLLLATKSTEYKKKNYIVLLVNAIPFLGEGLPKHIIVELRGYEKTNVGRRRYENMLAYGH